MTPAAAPPWRERARVWAVLALVQLAYCEWHVLAKQALSSGTHPLALALWREVTKRGTAQESRIRSMSTGPDARRGVAMAQIMFRRSLENRAARRRLCLCQPAQG